jgi:TPP-dependent pyruvate/acetoin dehydrogenase alpha subunit
MIWELPVVFVCENNASREDGRANAYQSAKDIAALAVVNRVEAAVADGRHVRQVVAALEQTAEGARTSSCPRFVEVRCGPWPGNATFYPRDVTGPTDIARARNSASDQWQGRDDPVLQEARELLAEGVAIDDLLRLDEETQSWIDDALVRARSWPDAERGLGEIALSDVWSGAA